MKETTIRTKFAIGDIVYYHYDEDDYEGRITGFIVGRHGVSLYLVSNGVKEHKFDEKRIFTTAEELLNSRVYDTIFLRMLDGSIKVHRREKPPTKFKVGDLVRKTYGYGCSDVFKVVNVRHDKRKGVLYDLRGIIGILGVEEHNLCFAHDDPYNQCKKSNEWNPPINKDDII